MMNYPIKIFNNRFYLKEVLILFCTYFLAEGIFKWLVIPSSSIAGNYDKILSIFIFFFTVYQFRNLSKTEQAYTVAFTALMIKLVFESLFEYSNFFNQFAIYTVIYPVIFAVFIKYVCRIHQLDLYDFIAKFYLFSYIIFMVLYGRGFSFSLGMVEMTDYGPFSGDSRVIHARSIFMMIIPYLWYLNRYIKTQKLKYIGWFLMCLIIIVIHQHRTVWSCTIISSVIYLLLSIKAKRSTVSGLFNLLAICTVLVLLAGFYLSNLFPGMLGFLSDRFSEILQPSKEGSTGNFRIEQAAVYGDYIMQKPIWGWSFKGFELPNPLVDWWEKNTGHHFHEGYIEILFYHGIVGLILKYSLLLIVFIKAFTKKISQEAIMMSAFCLSGFVFSLSYVLPLVFWAHVGLCLFYLDDKKEENDIHSYTGV